MKQMLDIPTDRKPVKAGRMCLLLGLTALLFIAVISEAYKTGSASSVAVQN